MVCKRAVLPPLFQTALVAHIVEFSLQTVHRIYKKCFTFRTQMDLKRPLKYVRIKSTKGSN